MKIYVIRHGETSWNRDRRLQGKDGADLNEDGVLLAGMTAEAMKDIPFDVCITSPQVRARHTAEIILGDREIPILEDERIMEIGFGVWEGKCCDHDNMEIPLEAFKTFHDDAYNYQPPQGGESIQDLLDRTRSFYEDLLADPERENQTILVSTHGCTTRAFLHNVYEDTSDYWHGRIPMNCAVSMVEVENGVGRLVMDDMIYYPEKYRINLYDARLNETAEDENTEKDA